jgi:hypothetical protein
VLVRCLAVALLIGAAVPGAATAQALSADQAARGAFLRGYRTPHAGAIPGTMGDAGEAWR